VIYLLIFTAWVVAVIFLLRFFAVSSPCQRDMAAHKITWEEILELDLFIADEAIKFDGLDQCIIGVDQRGFIVYCHDKMLDHFQKDGMSLEEAFEYISFNVVGIKPDNYTVVYNS
tara:strand:+ start:606 stop:950 length:345 start_codon:yes stop_codon:yes gene_type:complete